MPPFIEPANKDEVFVNRLLFPKGWAKKIQKLCEETGNTWEQLIMDNLDPDSLGVECADEDSDED